VLLLVLLPPPLELPLVELLVLLPLELPPLASGEPPVVELESLLHATSANTLTVAATMELRTTLDLFMSCAIPYSQKSEYRRTGQTVLPGTPWDLMPHLLFVFGMRRGQRPVLDTLITQFGCSGFRLGRSVAKRFPGARAARGA
jgi:hypothetical protein